MQYIKQAVFHAKNEKENDLLVEFFITLIGTPMYRTIVDEMMASPGFVRKELNIIEDTTGIVAINKMIFSDEESFNAYLENPSFNSTWEYLTMLAADEGLNIEVANLVVED